MYYLYVAYKVCSKKITGLFISLPFLFSIVEERYFVEKSRQIIS